MADLFPLIFLSFLVFFFCREGGMCFERVHFLVFMVETGGSSVAVAMSINCESDH